MSDDQAYYDELLGHVRTMILAELKDWKVDLATQTRGTLPTGTPGASPLPVGGVGGGGYPPGSHTTAWADITGTPTTLSGYGVLSDADGRYSAIGHTHTFASLTSKPTTLAGYGITNAYTKTEVDALVGAAHSHAFADLTGKPTTIAGYGITDAYTKTEVDSLIAAIPGAPTIPRQITWYQATLSVANAIGPVRRLDANVTLLSAYAYCRTVPTGASLNIDIKRSTTGPNGTFTTIFSSALSIAASADVGSSTGFTDTTLDAGDYLRLDITQLGSTVAGAYLTVDLNMSAR